MCLDNFKHRQEEDKNLQANAGKILQTNHVTNQSIPQREETGEGNTYFAKYMYTVAGTTR
jgi:hypothetical protein